MQNNAAEQTISGSIKKAASYIYKRKKLVRKIDHVTKREETQRFPKKSN